MSELPSGWSIVALSDVCKLPEQLIPHADKVLTYIDIKSIDRALKKVSKPQQLLGADAPSRARKLVEKGDVLVSMTRPNLNAVALIGDQHDGCIASTGFDVLKPIEVDPRWIFTAVRSISFVDAMCSKVQGALYPAVKSADIREYEIPLPPLAEQNRISQKLDELLTQVDTLKARIDGIPALLKRFRQSVLSAAVSGRLTEEWRAKNGAKIEVEGSAAETSEEFTWPMVRLGDVALDFSYGSSAKSQRDGDIPVLRMGNIQGGRLVWDDLVFSSNPEELKKYSLQVGDVLFNRTNSPELVGKTATYKGEQPAIYAGYLIRVRCSERLTSDFLNYCLNSPLGKDYCWQVKTDGVSQSNINAKKLADFRFGLPSTEEQSEIVRCVDQLFSFAERLEARVSDARISIDRLTQSILAKALRGDLVPQDPNDEPANLLLDRIKTQRAAVPKNKRGRRSTTEA
ncbi:Type I restriction enzyme, S subunit [Pseudomonas syringae pv. delphinii]|uniref:Type I restriction enzyme, S subunit n=1 Tax=Pseudomonas syringae pv. delphinii TaxID=192088 RepID=A0A0P9QD06_9PSED|nr:restriction endonuclease subunit S [Pseudomonas syringae group genomosp. 3]KPX26061.1 Type I restriction enzyme, S subunit [Pseudomonas syringae pv. delphinii]RMP18274.1 Type I restriction enzyme, S subunit [Pseudomonas syringae pv. delphinii]RMP21282.1 Type I restriction enzyme, S subunit [Pseudomonas syringae pv. delphinii]RMQ27827.1 Type I restriction enzyme, S subunit [Pseudomonas syringae pv. delphinii]